ncbi:enoyl CoA hydratase 1 [Gonapodya prolifera JEL478]|uniref:Enoyl CoA hydratase 1 n=1 Tax=Gonapodya prolifera (strain JEL478) TaxID=1344416 RepID=A0A139AP49_GONPJ|nr:enoyl CoA hydratase 1 [Gonapodya prolifera JEL478]|eukprot:KXS18520.1 enoyl CoA hydratase 1 [Gonapodya prolifera JEL478]
MPLDYTYEVLRCTFPTEGVLHVELNRPKGVYTSFNNHTFWREYKDCFDKVAEDGDVRAVVVSSNARIFTAGLDLSSSGLVDPKASPGAGPVAKPDAGRRAFHIRREVLKTQESFNAMESCDKPVIVAAHGKVVGGGIDLMTAADMRYCSEDATFTIKEVDVGLAADVGTLQRLQHAVGNPSFAREVVYTARWFTAAEALQHGLVSKVLPTKEDAVREALKVAAEIASKSPLAVTGSKNILNYSRDHSVADGLNYVAVWNAAALQSSDVATAAMASLKKQVAKFPKL